MVLPMVLTAIWLQLWDMPWAGMLSPFGDGMQVQVSLLAFAEAGPFSATPILGYPGEYSPWAHPQMSLLMALQSWLLGGVLSLPTLTVVWLLLLSSVALNGAACLYLLRSLPVHVPIALLVLLAGVFAASPFVLQRNVAHVNVAALHLLPVLVAVLLRYEARRRGPLLAVLAAATLASSLWWVAVVMLLTAAVVALDAVRGHWSSAKKALASSVVLLVASLPVLVLAAAHVDENANESRGAWDSNVLGGRLTDLLVASPWLSQNVARIGALEAGASVELSYIGLALAVVTVVGLLMLLRPVTSQFEARLRDVALVALLFFISGGLGNLQAAAAVLVGAASPARAWGRLIVLLALLALCVVLLRLGTARAAVLGRPLPAAVLTAVVLGAWALDAHALPRPAASGPEGVAEQQVVDFLRDSLPDGCGVAQLPRDAYPRPAVMSQDPTDVPRFYYRPLAFALLAPDLRWSYTGPNPLGDTAELTEASRQQLAARGFCAVLHDRELADTARAREVPLPGREAAALGTPDYADERYSVYLLR